MSDIKGIIKIVCWNVGASRSLIPFYFDQNYRMGEMVADYVDENLSDAVIFGQEVTKEFLEGYKEKLGNHWKFYGSFRCNDKLARITKNWGK